MWVCVGVRGCGQNITLTLDIIIIVCLATSKLINMSRYLRFFYVTLWEFNIKALIFVLHSLGAG